MESTGVEAGRAPGPLGFLTPARAAAGVFVALATVYLVTRAPTFGFADRGELAAVATTLGVAHPTGYPTVTLLGKLATLLLPLRDVAALNVLSALLTAAGGAVLVLLFSYLLRLVRADERPRRPAGSRKRREHRDGGAPPVAARGVEPAVAALAALLVGLTPTWWAQGTSFEVYSLHVLMMPLVTLLFLRFVEDAARTGRVGFTVSGVAFAVALGLSFTNHLTTVLLAAPMLVWYFWRVGVGRRAWWRLAYLVPPFLLGLAPYAYLPVRAAADPWFNWGDPQTPWALWRHVTGAQFQGWMFTNRETFGPHTSYALGHLADQLLYAGLGLALLGLVALAPRRSGVRVGPRDLAGAPRRRFLWTVAGVLAVGLGYLYLASAGDATPAEAPLYPLVGGFLLVLAGFVAAAVAATGRSGPLRPRVAVFALLALLVCLLYAGGYDIIVELDPYYLTAFFAIGLLLPFGLAWLVEHIGATVALAAGAALVVACGVANFPTADQRHHTLVEDMTVNMLASLPPDAVVFSKQWSFWVSGSYYLQQVEGLRPDVLVVDYELLRRSWYLDQLQANHPEFMARVRPQTEAFRAQLAHFEHDRPYDPRRLEAAYVGLIDAMIETTIDDRPVLVTPDFDEHPPRPDGRPYYGAAWQRVPTYLAYRLTDDDTYLPEEFPDYRFRFASGRPDWHTLATYWWYARSARDRALYEHAHGNQELAQRYLDYARSFDPGIDMDDVATEPFSRPQARQILTSFQQLATQQLPVTAPTRPGG
jgi:hypothetical protein